MIRVHPRQPRKVATRTTYPSTIFQKDSSVDHRPPPPRGDDFAIYLAASLPAGSRDTKPPRLVSLRGKTSGTEFKFHKLVCPLHPRRNRGRLISLLLPLHRGPAFFLARVAMRHADGSWKAWVPSLPAGRTGSRSGRPQIITRVYTADLAARSSRLLLEMIPLLFQPDPSWISPR